MSASSADKTAEALAEVVMSMVPVAVRLEAKLLIPEVRSRPLAVTWLLATPEAPTWNTIFAPPDNSMLGILDDVDCLVSSQSTFLMGKWIKEAREKGVDDAEKLYYERNARNLLTTWGEKAGLLNDYASRTWSGMTATFYGQRWRMPS